MSASRVRFTVRSTMVVVATVAGMLGLLRRPYPVGVLIVPTGVMSHDGSCERIKIEQRWSDGRLQTIEAQGTRGRILSITTTSEPWVTDRRHYGPMLRLKWSDGTTSYYLGGR
jgi:hypothetical protein